MELRINEVAIPERIEFNYEELKTELTDKLRMYETLVYTDDQIKDAKADRANLSKLKKALNDERIRREKEYMKPFNEFKAQVNEIIRIIDGPIAVIDRQVKSYETAQKEKKKDQVMEYLSQFDLPYDIQPEQILDQKWLNASASMSSVRKEIDARINKIKADVFVLEGLEDFQMVAIARYRKTLDLREAMNEVQRTRAITEQQKRFDEQRKAEAEKIVIKPESKMVEIPVQKEPEPESVWVNFSVKITVAQARELKEFFQSRAIEFRRIE